VKNFAATIAAVAYRSAPVTAAAEESTAAACPPIANACVERAARKLATAVGRVPPSVNRTTPPARCGRPGGERIREIGTGSEENRAGAADRNRYRNRGGVTVSASEPDHVVTVCSQLGATAAGIAVAVANRSLRASRSRNDHRIVGELKGYPGRANDVRPQG